MDEFFIHHLGMTHPPIWLLWVCIFYVVFKALVWFVTGEWYIKYGGK